MKREKKSCYQAGFGVAAGGSGHPGRGTATHSILRKRNWGDGSVQMLQTQGYEPSSFPCHPKAFS